MVSLTLTYADRTWWNYSKERRHGLPKIAAAVGVLSVEKENCCTRRPSWDDDDTARDELRHDRGTGYGVQYSTVPISRHVVFVIMMGGQ